MRHGGIRDLLKFSKPKTPGYGIWEDFYLTVLGARAPMPAPLVVANPRGEGGAVPGMIAPLGGESARTVLTQPLVRGVYGVASPNRRTVLEMTIIPVAESHFRPEDYLKSLYALELSPDTTARIQSTWTLAQFRFRAHDPMVRDSLAFVHAVARRLGELTDGVVADPLALRYLPWEQVPIVDPNAPLAAADFVSVRSEPCPDLAGTERASTHGLVKFGLAELLLRGIDETDFPVARRLLLGLAQTILQSGPVAAGDQVDGEGRRWTLAPAGDPDLRLTLEMLPPSGVSTASHLRGEGEPSS